MEELQPDALAPLQTRMVIRIKNETKRSATIVLVLLYFFGKPLLTNWFNFNSGKNRKSEVVGVQVVDPDPAVYLRQLRAIAADNEKDILHVRSTVAAMDDETTNSFSIKQHKAFVFAAQQLRLKSNYELQRKLKAMEVPGKLRFFHEGYLMLLIELNELESAATNAARSGDLKEAATVELQLQTRLKDDATSCLKELSAADIQLQDSTDYYSIKCEISGIREMLDTYGK